MWPYVFDFPIIDIDKIEIPKTDPAPPPEQTQLEPQEHCPCILCSKRKMLELCK